MTSSSSSRRGNLFDMFTILLVIAFAIVLLFIIVTIVNSLNTEIQASNLPSSGKDFIGTIQSQNGWAMDFIFTMLLIGLPFASAILAYFNNIPPFLYVISMGLWLLVVLIANALSDGYTALANTPGLQEAVYDIPMTNFLMTHLVAYSVFSLLIVAFGVYVKAQSAYGY